MHLGKGNRYLKTGEVIMKAVISEGLAVISILVMFILLSKVLLRAWDHEYDELMQPPQACKVHQELDYEFM